MGRRSARLADWRGHGTPARARKTLALLLAVTLAAWLGCLSTATAARLSPAWSASAPALLAGGDVAHTLSATRRQSRLTRELHAEMQLGFASAQLDGGRGSISGRVTSASTHLPLREIEVCAFTDEVEALGGGGCEITNAEGLYEISGLEAGRYLVEFSAAEEEGAQNYVRQYYNGTRSEEDAQTVPVASDGTTTEINAALKPGGSITGTITESEGHPLGEIQVCALEAGSTSPERCATTSAAGEYAIDGIAPEEHDVEFAVAFLSQQNYAPQYYHDSTTLLAAEAVSVSAEAVHSGIDAVLSPGGEITGTVTSVASRAALQGIQVCALPPAEGSFRCASTGASGDYALTSLAGGRYKVGFFSGSGEFAEQFYENAMTYFAGREVTVVAGGVTPLIDAMLQEAAPSNLSPPTISGSAVVGQTLKVNHGSWTNHPTSYEDEWGLCAGSGELRTCQTVAAGESYELSASDVGDSVRVREAAANGGGQGLLAYSPATAPISEAPAVTASGPQAGPAPGPPPVAANAVLGTTAAGPDLAQLTAMLSSALAPSGKNARLGALLKHGDYLASLDALSAGALVISWYLLPHGAHLATAKPVLAAVGRVSIAGPGHTLVKIKLTAQGRILLKRATRLRLTADGVFTPSGAPSISARKSFTLHR